MMRGLASAVAVVFLLAVHSVVWPRVQARRAAQGKEPLGWAGEIGVRAITNILLAAVGVALIILIGVLFAR